MPAATRTLRVLRYLAGQPEPVPLERIAQAVGLPRSTAYHLVNAMLAEGFVRTRRRSGGTDWGRGVRGRQRLLTAAAAAADRPQDHG